MLEERREEEDFETPTWEALLPSLYTLANVD
jgi:hypothetical protein